MRPLQTRPLTFLTFWLNYQLVGQSPWLFHLTNLLLHAAATLLLYGRLRHALTARPALAATALFALHPLQAEPVNYVYSRAILLAAVFCLLAWRFLEAKRWWAALACFAFALLAKEECVAFPAFLALLQWRQPWAWQGWKVLAGMLLLALAAGLRVVWATTQIAGSGAGAAAGISPLHYLALQGRSLLRYAQLFAFPWGYSVDPDLSRSVDASAWAAWAVVLSAVACALWRSRRSTAALWFLGGLLLLAPSSSVLPAADLAADRRMYLPLVAFAPALALALNAWLPRGYAVALLAALALVSTYRTWVWMSPERLWREAVHQAPDKTRSLLQLSRVVPPADAVPLLERARRIDPTDPAIPTELGYHHLLAGNAPAALADFGQALALQPNSANALNNRGAALLSLGQRDAARDDFCRALTLDPCQADAARNLRALGEPAALPSHCRVVAP